MTGHRRLGNSIALASFACTLAGAGLVQAQSGIIARGGQRNYIEQKSTGPQRGVLVPMEAMGSGSQSQGGIAGAAFSSGFEAPCSTAANAPPGFIGGGLSGQPLNCEWDSGGTATATQPRISSAAPVTGTQNLRFLRDTGQANGSPNFAADTNSRNWAFSDPDVAPAGPVVHLSLDVRITGTIPTQNAYIIQPQAPSEGFLTTVMVLNTDGAILVFDDNGNCADAFIQFVDTGDDWTPNVYHHIDICVDNPNDRIRYFFDGNLIYSTGAGEGGVGGPNGCGVFAGTTIEHVLLRYEGNLNDGSIMDVDNVVIEDGGCPEAVGACCGPGPGCAINTSTGCATAGGVFAGLGTVCSTPGLCAAVTGCNNAAGSCFESHGNPGCNDPECCVPICLGDPFCCNNDWDDSCVGTAEKICTFISCAQPEQNCQAISLANASNSTAGIFVVADNFTPAANGSVTGLCWYGAYLPDADDDTAPDDTFIVRYYDCVDGVPTDVIAEFTQGTDLTLVDKHTTNLLVAETGNIFEYVASHAGVPVTAGDQFFVEVINSALPVDSAWFWEFSGDADGDGVAFQKLDDPGLPYARNFRIANDVAFCLTLELGDLADICPVPAAIACELDVSGATVEEGEPCGSDPDLNLGCSEDPPGAFTDVTLSTDPLNPTLIHGEAWADAGTRDIDWYRFTAPASVDANADGEIFLCLAVAAELPISAVNAFDNSLGACTDLDIGVLESFAIDCGAVLAIGYPLDVSGGDSEQLILVRTNDGLEVFDGFPCTGPGPSGCPWDCQVTPDGEVAINDLLDLLAQWNGPGNCNFDGGVVAITDLLKLLANWGACPVTEIGNDYLLEAVLVDTFEECFPPPPKP